MRLDWALFSADDHSAFGGHRWRAGSRTAQDTPTGLDSYAELPPYAESQTGWEPFYTGLSTGDEIALCYVVPNRSAGRSNRLTTYVLFVPTHAASLWGALCALQNPGLFKGKDPIDIPEPPAPPASESATIEVQHVLQAFATVRKNQIVLQSVDEAQFLAALWQSLWPSARRALTFRRHFHPREISAAPPHPQLILVPDGTAWASDAGYHVIRPQGNGASPTPITVGPEFEGTLTQLRTYMNFMVSIKELPTADLSELQHLWGLLSSVPLAAGSEAEQEAQINAAISARIPGAEPEELLTLQGIVDMHGTLTSAVATWMQSQLNSGGSLPGEAWVKQVVDARDWMRIGLQEGLRNQQPSERAARLLWPWLSSKAGRDLLNSLNDTWEQAFARSLPKEPSPVGVRWAAKKQWWVLHGLLEIQRDLTGGLRVVFEKTPPRHMQAVLNTVLEVKNHRDLLQALEGLDGDAAQALASDLVMNNAALRPMIRADSAWWRQVWAQSLPGFRSVFDGLADPESLQRTLIDEHATHGEVPDALLTALARSGIHLLDRPDRASLWSKMPAEFLANSAAAYVKARTSPGPPDAVLLKAIHASGLSVSSDEAAQELATHLSDLTDEQARSVLERLRSPAREHVERTQEWSEGLVKRLYATMSHRAPDWLAPVLPDDMKLERAAARGETLPEDLWWSLACRVIPDRIMESPYQFWLAAGGKAGELEENGTARTKWVAALTTSRFTGKPPIGALLREILHSYDANQVRQLKETRPKVAK